MSSLVCEIWGWNFFIFCCLYIIWVSFFYTYHCFVMLSLRSIGKILFGLVFGFSFFAFKFVFAQVPPEYVANYEIAENYDKILGTFVKIDAKTQLWSDIDKEVFVDLYDRFEAVFPHFPQEYEFQVVYEQCLLTTKNLTKAVNHVRLSTFMEKCSKPFGNIISQINTNYTVLASARATPSGWPAPLTVTFDARASLDPSNETVPSNNFFWYYRDVDGIDRTIGVWPVINHTFEKAGNHIVHLTVRSSNKIAKWIFDGDETLSIDVAPKSAVLSIYANGKKLDGNDIVKIWVQEAQRWVVFDASATIPIGWRKLEQYVFEVTSSKWFSFRKAWEWSPGVFTVPLPSKWEFKISLSTVDNENNKLTEGFDLVVADPVALIKISPEEWTTSTRFSFDASPSYAVISSIRLYTREVFDQEWNKLETIQGKNFQKQFQRPWPYTIKLTVEDEMGKTDIANMKIQVESATPLAQFTMDQKIDWEYPSEFILDAWPSSDVDEINGFDILKYEWKFSDPEEVEIENNNDNNEKIIATFNKLWKQFVKLVVRDSFGKIAETEKEIVITSTLRPELFISPVAWTWWTPVNFVVRANEDILSYEWDFGDGETRILQTNRISHIYKRIGQYTLKLKVIGADGQENIVEKQIFVWEKDSPIPAYVIKSDQQIILTQNDVCTENVDWKTIEYPAYRLDRYEEFILDPEDSVNSQWESRDLAFYFQQKNDEIIKSNSFSSRFDELGCQYVDMTLEDKSLSKSAKVRVWFKVVNALPTLSNMVLYFPQYGNEMWIGFHENNVRDIFTTAYDPLMVKVVAMDSYDPDGSISYYKRYYYYKDDPLRILETKITPAWIPYAFFSMPRIPGEFMFGVTMYDNDDGKQRSEEIIWNGPIVFFPPDVKRPDIPLVTLKVNRSSAEVWDEIQFDVVSKIVSDKPDFIKERTIMYDFDWDGERDLTTKKDRVKHIYIKANEEWYVPRVAVLYRWYKWIAKWERIVVKKGLKPRLMFNHFDKYVIVRDVSLWEVDEKNICLSAVDCKMNDNFIIDDGIAFDFVYPEYKKYVAQMNVSDKHANKAMKRWVLDLTWESYSWYFHILSLPQPDIKNGRMEFFVWENLDNSILYNVLFDNANGAKDCYVDLDITVDSNEDGVKDQDRDMNCNELHFQKYEPQYDSVVARVYYQVWEKMMSEDFIVSFLDFEIDLPSDKRELYDKITIIVNWIDTSYDQNEYLKSLLISLKSGLLDDVDTKSTVVAIQDYMTTHEVVLTDDQASSLEVVITSLSDASVTAAEGKSEYEQAKSEILVILPHNLATDVKTKFFEFENTIGGEFDNEAGTDVSQQDQRKIILQDIVNMIWAAVPPAWSTVGDNQIHSDDMEIIVMPNMCKIMAFYDIPSTSCNNDGLKTIPQETKTDAVKKWVKWWVKALFIILWVVVISFIGVVVMFALKARQNEEEDEI